MTGMPARAVADVPGRPPSAVTGQTAGFGSAGQSRVLGRRGARTAGAGQEGRSARRGRRLEAVDRNPERLRAGLDGDMDRKRAGDEDDDDIEVVVVPVAADPTG